MSASETLCASSIAAIKTSETPIATSTGVIARRAAAVDERHRLNRRVSASARTASASRRCTPAIAPASVSFADTRSWFSGQSSHAGRAGSGSTRSHAHSITVTTTYAATVPQRAVLVSSRPDGYANTRCA